jgi:hypothetical protein
VVWEDLEDSKLNNLKVTRVDKVAPVDKGINNSLNSHLIYRICLEDWEVWEDLGRLVIRKWFMLSRSNNYRQWDLQINRLIYRHCRQLLEMLRQQLKEF